MTANVQYAPRSCVSSARNQVSAAGYSLVLRHSTDKGAHFGPARDIAQSTVAVGSPQLLQKNGHVFAAWNTAALA